MAMKGYVLGFGAVMLLVGAGVDYDSLSRAQGVALGTLSASDYAASIPARITALRADKAVASALAERQAVPPVDHLGPPPEGWTRRAWTIDDDAALHGLSPEDYAAWKKSLRKGPFATGAAAEMSATDRKRKERSTVVYQNGPQIIEVMATFTPQDPASDAAATVSPAVITQIAARQQTQARKQGFAYVDGVAYIDDRSGWSAGDTAGSVPFLTVRASLGDQITLAIRSRASDAALRQVIDQIDHAALNAMLDRPFPDVGPHMPHLDVAGQIALADLHLAAELARDAAILADYKAQMDRTGSAAVIPPQPRLSAMDAAMRAELDNRLAAQGQTMPSMPAAAARSAAPAVPSATETVAIRRPDGAPASRAGDGCSTEAGFKRCRVGN